MRSIRPKPLLLNGKKVGPHIPFILPVSIFHYLDVIYRVRRRKDPNWVSSFYLICLIPFSLPSPSLIQGSKGWVLQNSRHESRGTVIPRRVGSILSCCRPIPSVYGINHGVRRTSGTSPQSHPDVSCLPTPVGGTTWWPEPWPTPTPSLNHRCR